MSILLAANRKAAGHAEPTMAESKDNSRGLIAAFISGSLFGAALVGFGVWLSKDTVSAVQQVQPVAQLQNQAVASLSEQAQLLAKPQPQIQSVASAEIIMPEPPSKTVVAQPPPAVVQQQKPEALLVQAPVNTEHQPEIQLISGDKQEAPNLTLGENMLVEQEPASKDLIAALQQALLEVEQDQALKRPVGSQAEQVLAYEADPNIDELDPLRLPPSILSKLPSFSIDAHVYASASNKRWLKINGQDVQQGDKVLGSLTVVDIRPRDVVFAIEGHEFSISAIGGWPE